MARPKKKKADTAWEQPATPPPPLFTGEKERNLVKQVNDELIERVIGQQVLYYSIDIEHSNYHPLYGEAINKTFLPPVRIYALVKFDGIKTTAEDSFGLDKATKLEIHFHKRRLIEDQDLYVREGDFVMYGDTFYEIVGLQEPKQLFGQIENRFEVVANCIRARQSLFEAPIINSKTEPKFTKPIRQTTSTSTGSNSGYNPTSTGLFTNVIAENNLTVKNNTYLGDNPSDTVIITGSVYISGSLLVNGSTFSLSSSAVTNKTILITSSYAVQADDYFIGVDTNYTGIVITLPPLASTTNGRILHIKDQEGLADVGLEVTVSASSGEFIDLEPYVVIDVDHGSLSLYKASNGWNLF
jgi:hypothetical protein